MIEQIGARERDAIVNQWAQEVASLVRGHGGEMNWWDARAHIAHEHNVPLSDASYGVVAAEHQGLVTFSDDGETMFIVESS